MARRKKADFTWSTYSNTHIEGNDFFDEATFVIQCINHEGDRDLKMFFDMLRMIGCEFVEDVPGRVVGGTTEHRVRIKFPDKCTMEKKMTRYAGRRKKPLSLPEGSIFKTGSTVGEFLDWFDGEGGRGHTDAEGMEQLGISSKSTFRRWVKRAREHEKSDALWAV